MYPPRFLNGIGFSLLDLVLVLLGWPVLAVASNANDTPKPLNVVLILADDLGWTDLGCFGSDLYETPHIDQLARNGMKFNANYSACTVCSPTRAALLTGKYPARLHITDWIPGQPPENPKLVVPNFTKYLPHEETTIAEILREAGYATASIGKWHLGGPAYYPKTQGFGLNIAGTDAPEPRPGYFAPYKIDTITAGPEGEYITDRLGDEACRFLRDHADKPFFLYLPHFAVHTPIQGKPELVAKYKSRKRDKLRHVNAGYAAMIESLDQSVGRVRQTLEDLRIADRTIIVFTSDNGGRVPTTSNAPLRVGKGSCYEGGVRVPLIVYWPNETAEGSTCDVPVITMDIFPTILAMLHHPRTSEFATDGVSLVQLLRQQGTIPDRSLYWHYPHYQHYQQGGTTPYGAIRRGDYKLIEFYDDFRVELYNIRQDIAEQVNLAASSPELVNQLRKDLHDWRNSVHAQMPTPNPDYDPTRPEHVPKLKEKK